MKINVTGASGQLGRKVMRALLDHGAEANDLIASVRTPDKARDLTELGVAIRSGFMN